MESIIRFYKVMTGQYFPPGSLGTPFWFYPW